MSLDSNLVYVYLLSWYSLVWDLLPNAEALSPRHSSVPTWRRLLSVPTRASGKKTSPPSDRYLGLPILKHDASVLLEESEGGKKGRRELLEKRGAGR
jgi:hypothetical protein